MNIAIILAGGVGARTGQDVPKQFLCIDNKPVLVYTLEKFQKCDAIDKIVVAGLEGWELVVKAYAMQFGIDKLHKVITGGENRQGSICNAVFAVEDIAGENDIVCVYDANRPAIDERIIAKGVQMMEQGSEAIVGVTACYDTMFTSDLERDNILGPANRDVLMNGTGPDYIHYHNLRRLMDKYRDYPKALTVAEMCLLDNLPLKALETSSKCFKITTVDDVEIFKALLHADKYTWLK